MSLTPFASRKRALGAAATLSLAVASVGVALAPLADAATAAVTATLNVTSGPSAGTNSITMSASAATFVNPVAIEFQWVKDTKTACSAKYAAATAATGASGVVVVASPKFLTAKKAVITVPAGVVLAGSPLPSTAVWQVCVYSDNTANGSLIVSSPYTIAGAPTITSVAPAGGPALGGGQITVTGTNLSGNTVVKLGNATLVPTVNAAGTQITAMVPAQAAGPASDVVVTTTGGTVSSVGAYTYSNGLIISPNTTPTGVPATDIDISGVGLSKLTFGVTTTGNTPDNGNAHVYVVAGTYNPAPTNAAKTVAEAGECVNVLVISDTELICSVNTLKSFNNHNGDGPLANGTYTLTVVSNGGIDVQPGGGSADANYTQSIVSSGSTFTVAPY